MSAIANSFWGKSGEDGIRNDEIEPKNKAPSSLLGCLYSDLAL